MLEAPITEEELTSAIQALAKRKSLGPDGLTVNFFKVYCNFVSVNFTMMVNESLVCGRFRNGIICGLTALLFKEGDRLKLMNWKPTTLLNNTYNFLLMLYKRCYQPLLVEIIDND